jgi:parallel beta-helix repeat protein
MLKASVLVATLLARTWLVTPDGFVDATAPADSVLVAGDLQAAIDSASPMDTLLIARGLYEAHPKTYTESICGNCVEPVTRVEATVGFHIKDKPLVLIGKDRDSTVLVTNAGYGILFEGSSGSRISNLTVTGGVRDPDGNATDAAIVVKHGRLEVESVSIKDNTSRIDTVVVGIGGVFGREGAEVFILTNLIQNNGWDGVALYRGASAVIADNTIKDGRGAGIGITWDANAMVSRNRVSGYWKGIGAFGNTWASVRNNAVFDNLGWGIVATGTASMEVINNVIHHNGNCGFAVWRETARGVLKNNIITDNGWKEEWVCPGVGIWMNTSVDQFPTEFNNVWNNAAGDYSGVPDQTGIGGNVSQDPGFRDDGSFMLDNTSPCVDAGDSVTVDTDGTRSDMGIFGGPQAPGQPR